MTRGGRRENTRMAMMLTIIRARKVQPRNQIARADRLMPTTARPTYQPAWCSMVRYSWACQETGESDFVIISLYHFLKKYDTM